MTTNPLTTAKTATAKWRAAQEALEAAKEERDEAIRLASKSGCAQTTIAKETDLTRETIRRITNPEAAEAVRRSQRRTTAKAG